MKRIIVALMAVSLIVITGCSETERARNMSMNKWGNFHIYQYSGGKLIGEWDTNSCPTSESSSDGFNFVDAKTKKLQIVSGDLQIIER